ncbi:fatty acid desaturase [Flavipsychrobacter stenotrophus]|uniref:Fatty acid desaturase n=1 Tax=Flavipsychrobacter stenotrophus TaxID=2077091 RepID=A0A2S7T0G4_9BACT|nr:fatty acid desaturase [Flavipsychrobacter stenotrophus]PQJ12672.1 fatty acid desaturase [Flavipsychrobacter stenotrophus]
MLSGKELILATKPFAKEIRWKSWYTTLTSFCLLIASLLGTIYFPVIGGIPPIYGRILCSIFSALMLARVFIIFHDYQHHTILRNSYFANVLFTLFGVYMITPPSIWKRSHDHHHNNNAKLYSASIGSFPIMTRQKFMEANKEDKFYYLAVRHPLNMFLAYFTTFLYGMCIQSFMSNFRKHWDSLVVVIVHVSLAVFLFVHFGWLTWFLTFFIPFFISHMLGSYLFYAQHNFPGVRFRNNVDWNYVNAALESSSYMPMNPFMQWVTANIGFHHIHHLNSKIPFYRLPEAMAKIPELQQAKTTRLTPSEIIACLKLKAWDPEQDKMIGFDELYAEVS